VAQNIDDIFKIGDTVVVKLQHINPLLCYEEQNKIASQQPLPMPIDLSWEPRSYLRPDTIYSSLYVNDKDRLIIMSKALEAYECPSYIFKVKDKDDNQFYLSCEFFEKAYYNE
jgi:hypothetical protein